MGLASIKTSTYLSAIEAGFRNREYPIGYTPLKNSFDHLFEEEKEDGNLRKFVE
jgi:hypothetical protein